MLEQLEVLVLLVRGVRTVSDLQHTKTHTPTLWREHATKAHHSKKGHLQQWC